MRAMLQRGPRLMTSRKCPNRGAEWYSADTFMVWICEKCGAEMPVPGKAEVE